MAGTRITNLQSVGKQQPLILPHQVTGAAPGTVQMRIKSSQSSGERLSQTKSMVLQDPDLPPKPISRHRRNQSQHNIGGAGALETPVSMTDHHNELSGCMEAYEQKSKPGCSPDGMDLCGAVAEWTTEKSSRKNVLQIIY
ncbi:unnamed protein product [Coregonus sp. 'balchen']|nr:unnamed protein product [Coregonus sp. 'balchen']